jgi:hypothetical protein
MDFGRAEHTRARSSRRTRALPGPLVSAKPRDRRCVAAILSAKHWNSRTLVDPYHQSVLSSVFIRWVSALGCVFASADETSQVKPLKTVGAVYTTSLLYVVRERIPLSVTVSFATCGNNPLCIHMENRMFIPAATVQRRRNGPEQEHLILINRSRAQPSYLRYKLATNCHQNCPDIQRPSLPN